MYVSYAWERWAVGFSVNAPFGLVTDAPCNWSGRYYGCYSRIYDVNVQGNVAYKVNEWLTIGGGLSLNYMDAVSIRRRSTVYPPPAFRSEPGRWMETTWAWASARRPVHPRAGTTLGIGYRSSIDLNLQGQVSVYNPPVSNWRCSPPVQA